MGKYIDIGTKELKTATLYRACVSEIIATALLLFTHCQLTLRWPGFPEDGSIIQNAIGTAITVGAMIEGFGHISRAVINPAVTVCFLLTKRVSLVRAIFYVICQCIGGIAGTALSYVVTPKDLIGNFGGVFIHKDLTIAQGFLMEASLTFILVIVTLGAIDERMRALTMPSWAIAMAVGICVFTGATQTGTCMNPAVAIGPHVVLNRPEWWEQHWVYWAAPITGSVVATMTYYLILTWGVKSKDVTADADEKIVNEEMMNEIMDVVAAVCRKHQARVPAITNNGNKGQNGKEMYVPMDNMANSRL